MKKIVTIVLAFCFMAKFTYNFASAQYLDAPNNPHYLQQYIENNPGNINKPIIYVFYNNDPCDQCAEAMQMIYNIYEQNYSNKYSFFEINYAEPGEFNFRYDYNLSQPLSIVLANIRNGLNVGTYKIDNPQIWISDPSYFTQNITQQINSFFNS